MSTDSYNMDPERIERVLHPSSEQVRWLRVHVDRQMEIDWGEPEQVPT